MSAKHRGPRPAPAPQTARPVIVPNENVLKAMKAQSDAIDALTARVAALEATPAQRAEDASIRAELLAAPVPPLDKDYGTDEEAQYTAQVRAHYGGGRPFGTALHIRREPEGLCPTDSEGAA